MEKTKKAAHEGVALQELRANIDATAYISGKLNSMSKPNEGDGKFVVVENGRRVSDLHDSQAQALKEAAARKRVAESQGDKAIQPSVKQNLFGVIIILLVPVVSACAITCTS